VEAHPGAIEAQPGVMLASLLDEGSLCRRGGSSVDMGAHLIDVGANPEPMEAHSLDVKLPLESMRRGGHPVDLEANDKAMEAQP
jgi:hypothetical protein